MAEVNESMQKVVAKIANQHSMVLAGIYTISHIVIAMSCNYFITGTSLNMAAMDAIIEPIINGFWFYVLHKIYQAKMNNEWWPEAESNCRHEDFQSTALPTNPFIYKPLTVS